MGNTDGEADEEEEGVGVLNAESPPRRLRDLHHLLWGVASFYYLGCGVCLLLLGLSIITASFYYRRGSGFSMQKARHTAFVIRITCCCVCV